MINALKPAEDSRTRYLQPQIESKQPMKCSWSVSNGNRRDKQMAWQLFHSQSDEVGIQVYHAHVCRLLKHIKELTVDA